MRVLSLPRVVGSVADVSPAAMPVLCSPHNKNNVFAPTCDIRRPCARLEGDSSTAVRGSGARSRLGSTRTSPSLSPRLPFLGSRWRRVTPSSFFPVSNSNLSIACMYRARARLFRSLSSRRLASVARRGQKAAYIDRVPSSPSRGRPAGRPRVPCALGSAVWEIHAGGYMYCTSRVALR